MFEEDSSFKIHISFPLTFNLSNKFKGSAFTVPFIIILLNLSSKKNIVYTLENKTLTFILLFFFIFFIVKSYMSLSCSIE